MSKAVKILFYGNGSSGNHGCEAIVRGTIQLLGNAASTILFKNVYDEN